MFRLTIVTFLSIHRIVISLYTSDLAMVSMKFCNDSVIILLSNLRSQRLEFVELN